VAMSLIEHAARCMRPSRICWRAKVWLRRAPETLLDAALNEVAEPALNALNAFDHYSLLSQSNAAVLCAFVLLSAAIFAFFINRR
jgi:hypothetical protein